MWGLSPPSQRAQSPRTFLSLRPPKLILSSHPDKSGDQGLLQVVGRTGLFQANLYQEFRPALLLPKGGAARPPPPGSPPDVCSGESVMSLSISSRVRSTPPLLQAQ